MKLGEIISLSRTSRRLMRCSELFKHSLVDNVGVLLWITHQHHQYRVFTGTLRRPHLSLCNTTAWEEVQSIRCVWCLSFLFLSYCYTTSKQTNERSLQFYLQLWKAAGSPNLSSLAPGCSPKSHSSDSLRLPVPGNLLQPWTNPQKDTLITRARTYTATFRGNKSLRQTSGTTHQTARFLLNAAIFDKLSHLQEWLRCNINLQAAIKQTARRIVPFSYIEKSKRLLLTGHLICAAVMGLPLAGNKRRSEGRAHHFYTLDIHPLSLLRNYS